MKASYKHFQQKVLQIQNICGLSVSLGKIFYSLLVLMKMLLAICYVRHHFADVGHKSRNNEAKKDDDHHDHDHHHCQ